MEFKEKIRRAIAQGIVEYYMEKYDNDEHWTRQEIERDSSEQEKC
jgi:hypothetical protein